MITTADAPLPPEAETEDHVALDEDDVLTPAFVEKVGDAADDGDGGFVVDIAGRDRPVHRATVGADQRCFGRAAR